LAAAAAREEIREVVGQVDRGGVADQDGREPPEQGNGRRVRRDRLAEGAFKGLAEEIDQGLPGGEALLDGGLGNRQAKLSGREVEVGPGGIGLAQEGGDEQQQQGAAGENALAADDLALAGEFVEVLIQMLLQGRGDG
jgi:hypothetical protein